MLFQFLFIFTSSPLGPYTLHTNILELTSLADILLLVSYITKDFTRSTASGSTPGRSSGQGVGVDSGNVILWKSGNSAWPGHVSSVGVPRCCSTMASCSMSDSPWEPPKVTKVNDSSFYVILACLSLRWLLRLRFNILNLLKLIGRRATRYPLHAARKPAPNGGRRSSRDVSRTGRFLWRRRRRRSAASCSRKRFASSFASIAAS